MKMRYLVYVLDVFGKLTRPLYREYGQEHYVFDDYVGYETPVKAAESIEDAVARDRASEEDCVIVMGVR